MHPDVNRKHFLSFNLLSERYLTKNEVTKNEYRKFALVGSASISATNTATLIG